MKVERIAKDKVRIFVSYEDLEERGINKDEIWQNGRKVQELFWDMMETAYLEVGFEVVGPIAVEAFTMPTEGVVVIVTRVPKLPGNHKPDEDEDMDVELNTETLATFVFKFHEFEDVIQVAHVLQDYPVDGALYRYKEAYYLHFDASLLSDELYDSVWAVLNEYGEVANVTHAMLEEYGVCILADDAINEIVKKFVI